MGYIWSSIKIGFRAGEAPEKIMSAEHVHGMPLDTGTAHHGGQHRHVLVTPHDRRHAGHAESHENRQSLAEQAAVP